jgi:hypothetical protein
MSSLIIGAVGRDGPIPVRPPYGITRFGHLGGRTTAVDRGRATESVGPTARSGWPRARTLHREHLDRGSPGRWRTGAVAAGVGGGVQNHGRDRTERGRWVGAVGVCGAAPGAVAPGRAAVTAPDARWPARRPSLALRCVPVEWRSSVRAPGISERAQCPRRPGSPGGVHADPLQAGG